MLSIQLQCDACGWWTLCGEPEIVRRLRAVGHFRRASDPPEEIVREVLRTDGRRLACDRCRATGLRLADGAEPDAAQWDQVVMCEVCRQPIPPERLEVLPWAKRCAACQGQTDRGATFAEPDYCPRCGSLVEVRVSRAGGVTRYKLWCTGNPPCRL
ncbi:MAG TPA: TraR/DksA C4-type zinc finger protein [Lacipirellulaceae bacterium]|nr:TraR/DksA C4-type zinc finger protein [Lacipirellulaceae bacterium]